MPLIGFIGRLDYQKGADLVLGAVPWLMDRDVQLVCLGTGDVSLEVHCSGCARQNIHYASSAERVPFGLH